MALRPGHTRYREIVVRVTPNLTAEARRERAESWPDEPTQSYTALIYTALPLPWARSSLRPPVTAPESIADLPLQAVEQLTVRWGHYRKYLDAFLEGAQSAVRLRHQIFKMLSSGLEALFQQPFEQDPVRIWCSNETPELDDLPWELVVYGEGRRKPGQFSFVRGLPGELVPLVPLEGPLKIAVGGSLYAASPALRAALEMLPPACEVDFMKGDPRSWLKAVLSGGYHIVHLLADGNVSLGHEGVLLCDDGYQQPTMLTASELSSRLRGSRVTLLSLSPAALLPQPDPGAAPSVFRAFTSFGSSRVALPSVLAPIGPMREGTVHEFWPLFYRELARRLSLEEALGAAHVAIPALPMALYLRHRAGREFRHIDTLGSSSSPTTTEPTNMASELQIGRDLLESLRAIDARFGNLPGKITDSPAAKRAANRQDQLESDLDVWKSLGESEL